MMLLSTMNPTNYSGREILSNALQNRFISYNLPNLSEYSLEDISKMIQNMGDDNNLELQENIYNMIKSGDIVNIREIKNILNSNKIDQMKKEDQMRNNLVHTGSPQQGSKRKLNVPVNTENKKNSVMNNLAV